MAELDPDEAWARFAAEPFARLATVRPDGTPHLVPITFAVDGNVLVTAVDHKPKRTMNLQRLDNLRHQPRCAVLVDHADPDDWSQLWWVRADGAATIVDPLPSGHPGLVALCSKYPQYRERPPEGALIWIEIDRWTGWSAVP